jgi:hypothetical protein
MKALCGVRDVLHYAIVSTVFGPSINISTFFSAPFSNMVFRDWPSIKNLTNI